jgi:hypothetical protein
LERADAIKLLKEFVALNLASPSFVSVEKNGQGTFDLKMKANGNISAIRQMIAKKNLIIAENQTDGTCTISSP